MDMTTVAEEEEEVSRFLFPFVEFAHMFTADSGYNGGGSSQHYSGGNQSYGGGGGGYDNQSGGGGGGGRW